MYLSRLSSVPLLNYMLLDVIHTETRDSYTMLHDREA